MKNRNSNASTEKGIKINYKRVSLNVPVNVYEKIANFAKENGFNFSQAIITLSQKSLEQNILIESLPEILKSIKKNNGK